MNTPNRHEGDFRGFTILSQSWYADSNLSPAERKNGVDEILFGLFAPEGGTSGELSIRWKPLQGKAVPQLQAFDDSWSALATFADLLPKLAELDNTQPTVEQVAAVLMSCGFVDMTERRNPRAKDDAPNIRALASVLQVYLDGVNKLRELGRLSSGIPTWASDVEFGKRPARVDGISADLLEEVHEMGQNAARKRDDLRARLDRLGDQKLIAEYAHLTEDTSSR